MRCQFGALNEYLSLYCVGSDLAQRLREQSGQMGFEIQNNRHETAPFKEARIISLRDYRDRL